MRLVIVESPFAGKGETEAERATDLARNIRYLRACLHDCFKRGEAPYASHALYTQPGVLDDGVVADRELGINAGFKWRAKADATVVYTDRGISGGMRYGVAAAEKLREGLRRALFDDPTVEMFHPIEYRELGEGWEREALAREASFNTKWPKEST